MSQSTVSNFELFKINLWMRLFGVFQIPLVGFIRPWIIETNERRLILKVPLNRRNRNHFKSMYFGALSIGAEVCMAVIAVMKIYRQNLPVDFVFKDFKADFLKRATGDVHFICEEVHIISQQLEEALRSEDRIHRLLKAYAIVPSVSTTEHIAEFEITLSLKKRKKKS